MLQMKDVSVVDYLLKITKDDDKLTAQELYEIITRVIFFFKQCNRTRASKKGTNNEFDVDNLTTPQVLNAKKAGSSSLKDSQLNIIREQNGNLKMKKNM